MHLIWLCVLDCVVGVGGVFFCLVLFVLVFCCFGVD